MSALARLGRSATVYVISSILQKGTAFLLLPLYTRFMPPSQYGIYSVVLALSQLLAVVFPLQLDAAVLRFYYLYRDDHEKLREFWGSVLTFMVLFSGATGLFLLLFGDFLLRPVVGQIPIWPYVAIGIVISIFQPFFTVFLAVLQARERSIRYSIASFLFFLSTTLTTIALVVWAGFGALGPLISICGGTIIFAIAALIILRPDYRICLKWNHIRQALGYSLPTMPHAMAGTILGISDRIALNLLKGVATTGVYNIGAVIGSAVEMIASGANRAYIPIGMSIRSREDPEQFRQLHELGVAVIAILCLAGAGLSIFSREIVYVFAAQAFQAARFVIPFIAFGGVASGIYYILVNVLFFDRHWVRYIWVGTGLAAAVSIAINFTLIPVLGMMGSAVASLVAQLVSTTVIAFIGSRIDPVPWHYGMIALVYGVCLIVAFAVVYLLAGLSIGIFVMKATIFAALVPAIGLILWRDPMRLPYFALRLVRNRTLRAI
ncbi:MAG TPA: oligosaccharide flippase family protein [Rhizomicrobium sp.]|jgi:O-antigen/teichoic acid export membrane protein|nr:oligosaccharide flippase family protein [Rhizomicrobium sp.]